MKAIRSFIHQCVYLTWLMAVQDPPVEIEPVPEVGTRFDPNVYRQYTKTGIKIAFVVWPALRLCKGGALLCKGVAEPEKTKEAWSRNSGKSDSTRPKTAPDTSQKKMEENEDYVVIERPRSQSEHSTAPAATSDTYNNPSKHLDQFRDQSLQQQPQQQQQQQYQHQQHQQYLPTKQQQLGHQQQLQQNQAQYRQGDAIYTSSLAPGQNSTTQMWNIQGPYPQASNAAQNSFGSPTTPSNSPRRTERNADQVVPSASALSLYNLHLRFPNVYSKEYVENTIGPEMYIACWQKICFGQNYGQTDC